MKKFTLALLAAFSSAGMVYSQANISVEAPIHNTNYVDLLPMGASTEATMTAVYLYNTNDLSALTGSNVTSLGIQIYRGVTGNTPVSGSFSVYLQNTNDMTYNAGTSFTTAISTMTNYYAGTFVVPASQSSSTVNINFPTTFTYTGHGIYVGLKWQSTGPFVTATSTADLAAYPSNTGVTGTDMGAIEEVATGSPITDVMSTTAARPSLLFRAVNTATNEAGVVTIIAPGKVAKSINAGHVIQAYVRNGSINSLSNITVSLAVSGANTFNNTQSISSLAAGATATVSFAAFNPTVMGVNHVSVTLGADQNANNNMLVWTQSVTCNVMGNNPPDAIASFSGAVGFPNSSGIFSTAFTPGANTTLTAVRAALSTDANNIGKKVIGVVMDASGTVLATSDTLVITAALNSTFASLKFTNGQGPALSANTTYFIGMGQTMSGHYPMAYETGTYLQPGQFFASPLTGGSFNNSNFGYYGIEPVLGPDVSVATTANTVICKGESISLTADGASTYTWSAVPNNTNTTIGTPNAANITVSPAVTVTYTVKGTDAAGCINSVTYKEIVNACTGIATNNAQDANIRLFPNPSNGKCFVGGLEGTNTIAVYNMLGAVVLTKTTSDATVAIDLGSQPEGTYLVRVIDGSNHAKTLKFINQH